jgi:hypothetical protein
LNQRESDLRVLDSRRLDVGRELESPSLLAKQRKRDRGVEQDERREEDGCDRAHL